MEVGSPHDKDFSDKLHTLPTPYFALIAVASTVLLILVFLVVDWNLRRRDLRRLENFETAQFAPQRSRTVLWCLSVPDRLGLMSKL